MESAASAKFLRILPALRAPGTSVKTKTNRPPKIDTAHKFRGSFGTHNCAEVFAVVATATEIDAGVPAVTWTVAGTVQVGAKLGLGLTLQLRLTVPENPP